MRYNKDITLINNLLYYVLIIGGAIYGIVIGSLAISISSILIVMILHFSIITYILNPLHKFISGEHLKELPADCAAAMLWMNVGYKVLIYSFEQNSGFIFDHNGIRFQTGELVPVYIDIEKHIADGKYTMLKLLPGATHKYIRDRKTCAPIGLVVTDQYGANTIYYNRRNI